MSIGSEKAMGEEEPKYSIVVVGAGIAGLAAAKELSKCFPDVLVVEASDRLGGRIKQVGGLLPQPIELGPHFIHGSKTSLGEVMKEAGCNWIEHVWPDLWYFSKDKIMLTNAKQDPDISAVNNLFENVGDLDTPTEDVSAENWLRQNGANERMIDIAEACYANDFGCSLSQMGLRETILENQKWDSGEEYLVLDRPLSALTDYLHKSSSFSVLRGWPVLSIEHGRNGVLLKSHSGRCIQCKCVLITVPLKVLQKSDIRFVPDLPRWKQDALNRIQMSNAIKVIIILDKQIWPSDFFDVVCPGGFLPEFWKVDEHESVASGQSQQFGIVGFVAGRKAEQMSSMHSSAIISKTLSQLDEIFGHGPLRSHTRYPATNAFVKAHVADWSREKYIGGAYSYPSLGALKGDRELLARSVGNQLFFAGEATHPSVNPCLQAAYETGLFAAKAILSMEREAHSKL